MIKTQSDTKHGASESGLGLFGKLKRTRERKSGISRPTHLLNLPALPAALPDTGSEEREWKGRSRVEDQSGSFREYIGLSWRLQDEGLGRADMKG